jgi:hypothetical protein
VLLVGGEDDALKKKKKKQVNTWFGLVARGTQNQNQQF